MDWLSIIGNGAFGLSALSLLARDILVLRVVSIASGIASIGYNYYVPGGPLFLPIAWVCFFILINIVQISIVMAERRPHRLPDEDAELHESVFPNFTTVEFRKLRRLGTWQDIPAGTILGTQGQNPRQILVVAHGRCEAERDGKVIRRLGDGSMIGEMALITDRPFQATVKAVTPLRCLVWPKAKLTQFFARNPLIALAMESAFITAVSTELGSGLADLEHG